MLSTVYFIPREAPVIWSLYQTYNRWLKNNSILNTLVRNDYAFHEMALFWSRSVTHVAIVTIITYLLQEQVQ